MEVRQLQEKTFPNCKLLPGAERLVRELAIKKIPMAVATSSPRATFELKTQNHKDLFSLFHHVVCGSSDSEVKAGKPAPDIFQVCASRFDPPLPHPASCLVLEDSPAGVRAALAADMRSHSRHQKPGRAHPRPADVSLWCLLVVTRTVP